MLFYFIVVMMLLNVSKRHLLQGYSLYSNGIVFLISQTLCPQIIDDNPLKGLLEEPFPSS